MPNRMLNHKYFHSFFLVILYVYIHISPKDLKIESINKKLPVTTIASMLIKLLNAESILSAMLINIKLIKIDINSFITYHRLHYNIIKLYYILQIFHILPLKFNKNLYIIFLERERYGS